MNILISKEVKNVIDQINQKNYEAYLVGGAVRDGIIGISNNDLDLCTNMPLEEVKKLFPNFVIMRENNHRNTGVFRIGTQVIEISAFHGETIEEDLSKRDLTMNAIAADKNGNIIDPYNGISDIKNQTISLTDKSGKGLDEDPLRILRIIRFSAIYGYKIDADTQAMMKEKKEKLTEVAKERIYSELKKILLSNQPSKVIEDNIEIFCTIIPELKSIINYNQHNPHHIYDVFTHTMKVLDNTPKNIYLRLAALFHDIGKPNNMILDENGIGHFLGHEFTSKDIFHEFAIKYKIDEKTRKTVEKLILFHDRKLSIRKAKIIQLLQEFGTDDIELLFELKKADIKGQNPAFLNRLEELNQIHDLYTEDQDDMCITVKDLKINGYKLMEMGFFDKKIGIILKDVLDKVTAETLVNDSQQIEDYIKKTY